jgi:hypothetical protein
MVNSAKLWIGIVSLLVVSAISYSVVMALGSPAPVDSTASDLTVGADPGISPATNQSEPVELDEPIVYVTNYNSDGSEDMGSVATDFSTIPGTDVVTIAVNGVIIVVDIEWSETKRGIVTYDQLTFNDSSGELLTLTGPYELSDAGFVAIDYQATRENPGQLFFSTVEGRYYRYDPKSDPRLVLIKTNQ